MRARLRRYLITVLTGSALAVLTGGVGIRQDDFECEEAVAHLAQCCPNFPVDALTCRYDAGCSVIQYPDLDVPQAQCLRERSCDELRALGSCDQSQWQPRFTCSEKGGAGDPPPSQQGCLTKVPVCR